MRTCPTCAAALDDDHNYCPTDGTALDGGRRTRDPMIGASFDGRYRISAKLGEGGMGCVYLAYHATLARNVAIKVLHPMLAESEAAVKRFAREARAASVIDHENVVQVLDFARTSSGEHFIAMEHVVGTALSQEIERNAPLTPPRAVHILAQIAAGVGRGHDHGIIHRDLKPENVLLCTRGSDPDFVKLVDFGLAKSLGAGLGDGALTLPGSIFGTPEYMAPEQWTCSATGARTDIYALGVMGYELVTGELPFEGSPIDLMHHHLSDEPVLPHVRAPAAGIPVELSTLILACMRKDPAMRPQSMGDVLAGLGRLWDVLSAPVRSTSYGSTMAAPPRLSTDAIPDPTVYQTGLLNAVWDGPLLCDEIGRLHALRKRRLVELADALWGASPPPAVDELRSPIERLEGVIDEHGQRVAVLRAELDEGAKRDRTREGELRHEMIDASLAVGASARRLPADVPELPRSADPPRTLRQAERRLASYSAKALRDRLSREAALGEELGALREMELQLMPLYEKLSRLVQQAGRGRPELRSVLVAYGQVDGAIASYQALLELMDDEPTERTSS